MADFRDPTAIEADDSTRSQAAAFRARYPTKQWAHQVAGGEHVVALVFRASRPVTAAEAKALANQLQDLHDELTQSGAMLACTLPEAEQVPDGQDMHFRATFEVMTVDP